jgi:hypothetical protein
MLTFIKSFNVHPSASSSALNWQDIFWFVSANYGTVTSKQVTGITGSLNINITEQLTEPDISLWYQVTNSQITGNVTGAPSSPWIQVSGVGNGTSFSVNNNQWVSFCCYGTVTNKDLRTLITVYNDDTNAVIDTFSIDIGD